MPPDHVLNLHVPVLLSTGAVVALQGGLTRHTAGCLCSTAHLLCQGHRPHLIVDLRHLVSCDTDGVDALISVRELTGHHRGGVRLAALPDEPPHRGLRTALATHFTLFPTLTAACEHWPPDTPKAAVPPSTRAPRPP
ncbi:STAS domain-containing protein [Streptomyces rimosus]|uniref:STAS domain-containing protein n=1 Tax=Streptomyces rimosus TaxID=1927 RepID=UPI0037D6EDE0